MKCCIVVTVMVFLYSCSTTIYVVRHAEKADASADPDLSPAGVGRAAALKDSLENKTLTAVFATQFKRTYQTVEPAANERNTDITRYNASKSDSLMLALSQRKGKNFLVAGHSNTVPAMLRKIGLHPSMQDIPDNDYDNLFIVNIRWFFGKKMKLTESHYGAVSP